MWTGITLLNFVVRMTLDVCCNDDLHGKALSTWRNTFFPLVCCKSFNNQVKNNQDSYLLLDYILINTSHLSSGYVSWRDSDTGSWFIQSLCKELQEHASSKHFVDILTRTSRRVAIDYESCNTKKPWEHQQKQVPSFNSMLIRDLYFRSRTL